MIETVAISLILGGGIFIGYGIGSTNKDNEWEQKLINRGLAQYNNITGEWEWIEK